MLYTHFTPVLFKYSYVLLAMSQEHLLLAFFVSRLTTGAVQCFCSVLFWFFMPLVCYELALLYTPSSELPVSVTPGYLGMSVSMLCRLLSFEVLELETLLPLSPCTDNE